jgi:YidC/Oxa1 family membrane protein insertase
MTEKHNLIFAIIFSIAILAGYQFYIGFKYPSSPVDQQQGDPAGETAKGAAPATPTVIGGSRLPAAPGAMPPIEQVAAKDRQTVIAEGGPRVKISSPRLRGSIALTGGLIDDLTLVGYREEMDPESDEIVFMSPPGSPGTYYARFGWVRESGLEVPTPETVWRADGDTLSPANPVTLTWDNGQGLKFSQTYALDENYMFKIIQRVDNTGVQPVNLFPYGLISRWGTPKVTGFFIMHEGLLGVFDGTLDEVDYDDVSEQSIFKPCASDRERPPGNLFWKCTTGGWFGITDKYWLATIIPDQKAQVESRFSHRLDNGVDKYQVDFLGGQRALPPGATVEVESRLFTGAKEVSLIDGYHDSLGIGRFDMAIDWGWFPYLTKPLFHSLVFFNNHFGNFGLAILLLTVAIKLVFFPLANKSYKAMSKMKKLQPEMLKLREQFGGDKTRLNQEMMALYKREKANPASGCFPVLIQVPVFFALYKVLFIAIEMRHEPFYGWIKDLSAPDPTTLFNLFGLIPWTPPEFLMIGVWPILMGVTMFLQQRLNPQPVDPVQAKIFMFLPIMFTFLLARFPAGLVIYWAWNNLLSVIQQQVIMRRMGVK